MADSSRNLRDYTRAVDRTSQLADRVLGELFERYGDLSVDDLRDALLLGVPGVVERFGEVAVEAALEYYERERSQVTSSYYRQARRVRVSVREIERTLRYHVGKLYEGDSAGFRQAVEAEVDRWVKLAGRRALMATSETDKACTGWARIPTGAETCAFCFMLASRGFAYKTADSAGLERKFHKKCDCRVVPEFLGKTPSIKGYDPDAMYAVYKDSHQKGDKASDVLERMRWKNPEMFTDGVGYGGRSSGEGRGRGIRLSRFRKNSNIAVGAWPDGKPNALGGVRPYESLDKTPRVVGSTAFQDRVKDVNPLFNKESEWPEIWGTRFAYKVNCVRCSAALTLQRMGYDVRAGAGVYRAESGGWNSADMLSKWRRNGEPVTFTFKPIRSGSSTISNRNTLTALESEPIGSFGVVRAGWKLGGSHIWNYEITSERGLVFWDGQVGKEIPVSEYYSEFKRGTLMYARLDDAVPTDSILEVVSIDEPLRKKR